MKTRTLLLSAALLSTVAFNALAASPNGPKPKCPMGEIPVLENGSWQCKEPSIKAPTRPQASTAAPSRGGIKIQKASIAMPDLSIANVSKKNDPTPNVDTYSVYVKNTGNKDSAPCKMYFNASSGQGEFNVPQIKAGSGEWIEVKYFEYKDGSRISLYVDSQKTVAETNEGNNKYAFNW